MEKTGYSVILAEAIINQYYLLNPMFGNFNFDFKFRQY